MVDINTTPLIDVMLVLLIMLILSVPAQTHALKMDLPQARAAEPPPRAMAIDIDADGSIAWNGEALADERELEARLREAAARAPQPPVQLRPNRLVEYGRVAMALAAAQREGIRVIGIVAGEQK